MWPLKSVSSCFWQEAQLWTEHLSDYSTIERERKKKKLQQLLLLSCVFGAHAHNINILLFAFHRAISARTRCYYQVFAPTC